MKFLHHSLPIRRYRKLTVLLCLTWFLYLLFLSVSRFDDYRTLAKALRSQDTIESEPSSDKFETTISTEFLRSSYDVPDIYNQDHRLTLGLLFHHLNQKTTLTIKQLNELKIPFSWYDYVGSVSSNINKFISLPKQMKFDCSLVCRNNLKKNDEDVLEAVLENQGAIDMKNDDSLKRLRSFRKTKEARKCGRYCEDDNSKNSPGFKIFKNLYKGKSYIKKLQSASYLYSFAPTPDKLIILNNNGEDLSMGVESNEKAEDKQKFNIKSQKWANQYVKTSETFKLNALDEFNSLTTKLQKSPPSINPNTNFTIQLNHDDFLFNSTEYLIDHKNSKDPQEIKFMDSIRNSLYSKSATLPKYFQELKAPSNSIAGDSSHIDWRFYKGEGALTQADHDKIIKTLIDTWFKFTMKHEIVSWISHGGLLAHNSNGLQFPWDSDVDVQLPYKYFAKLASQFNNTLIISDPNDLLQNNGGIYLIDITSSLTHRDRGNGLNNIDARFIDVSNGFFIDITALGVSSTSLPVKYKKEYSELISSDNYQVDHNDPNLVYDIFYEPMTTAEKHSLMRDDPELLRSIKQAKQWRKIAFLTDDKTHEEKYDINYKLQVYNCRNQHFYKLDQLSPLRFTYYSQVPVIIPNKIESILKEEYDPLNVDWILSKYYNGYTYVAALRLWVKTNVLDKTLKDLEMTKEIDDKDYIKPTQIDSLINTNEEWKTQYNEGKEYTRFNEVEKFLLLDSSKNEAGKLNDLKKIFEEFTVSKQLNADPYYLKIDTYLEQYRNDEFYIDLELKKKFLLNGYASAKNQDMKGKLKDNLVRLLTRFEPDSSPEKTATELIEARIGTSLDADKEKNKPDILEQETKPQPKNDGEPRPRHIDETDWEVVQDIAP